MTDIWNRFRLELERQAESVFASSGEVIVVSRDPDSEAVLTLTSRTKNLVLTYIADKDVIRWESTGEYSFERLSMPSAPLARALIQKLRT